MVVEYSGHLASQGHDVAIITGIFNTVFHVRAKVKLILGRSKIKTILKALAIKANADIIIADIIVMVFFLSFRNKGKLLYFAQDYDESYYKNPLMRILIRILYFYCLARQRIPVIAVSEELGALLQHRFNAEVAIVPNGIDTDTFYPERDKGYLALKGDRKAILVFARSDYRKGFDIAVQVLHRFKREIEADLVSVWAVGESIPASFPIRNFGFVPPDQLRKILSCSDVLLYPSRHEGLPLFVLEAMACGCPVVTTEAVGIVEDGVNGVACPIGNVDCLYGSLSDLIHRQGSREGMVRNASATVAKYSLNVSKAMFERYLYDFTQRSELLKGG